MWIGNMVENNKAVVHKSKRPPKMKFKMKTNLKQQQQPQRKKKQLKMFMQRLLLKTTMDE